MTVTEGSKSLPLGTSNFHFFHKSRFLKRYIMTDSVTHFLLLSNHFIISSWWNGRTLYRLSFFIVGECLHAAMKKGDVLVQVCSDMCSNVKRPTREIHPDILESAAFRSRYKHLSVFSDWLSSCTGKA